MKRKSAAVAFAFCPPLLTEPQPQRDRQEFKDIVLAIANKEGGAQVDGDMSAKYVSAKNQGKIVVGGKPVSDVVRLGSFGDLV